MRKTLAPLLFFLFIQVLATAAIAVSAAYGLGKEKAPQGLNFLGVDLAGLSQAQAWAEIEKKLPKAVVFGDNIYPLFPEQTERDWQEWLSEQYKPKTDSWVVNALDFLARSDAGQFLPPPTLNRAEIIGQLEKVKEQVDLSPYPAGITYLNGKLFRETGMAGRELDIEGTWQALLTFPSDGKVELKVNTLLPRPADSDVAKVKDLLGDYTTFFDPNDRAQTTNVRLAAKALDSKLIAPGDVFSFNSAVGERTESKGYLPASVIADNKLANADGGGVCQDSSTLYQAAKQAGLKILERNTHSLPVAYVPKGQEATVAYGRLDFRFLNDTQGYLLISAQAGKNWLRIRLFGQADDKHPVLDKPEAYPLAPKDLETYLK